MSFSIKGATADEIDEERKARTKKLLELHEMLLTVEMLDLNEQFHVRMLNYHCWNVDAAFHHIVAVIRWRAEFKPHQLTVNNLRAEIVDSGLARIYGSDRVNRPCLLLQSGRLTTKAKQWIVCGSEAAVTRAQLRLVLIWAIERALKRRTSGVSTFMVIYDRSHYVKKIHKHGEEMMLREMMGVTNDKYSGLMSLFLVVGVHESERQRWETARQGSNARIDFLCGDLPDSRLGKFFHSGTLPPSLMLPLALRSKRKEKMRKKKKKKSKKELDWTQRLDDVEKRVKKKATELGLLEML